MERSESIGQLAAALSKAQSVFRGVPKGRTARIKTRSGAEYSYKYADLADVWDTCRAALAENKLSIIQLPEDAGEDRIGVTTMLCHESGEWISGFLGMRIADASRTGEMSPQALGMAVTYLRRYGFAAIIGLVTDDDTDAQSGQQQPAQQSEQKPRPAPRAPQPANGAKSPPSRVELEQRIADILAEAREAKATIPAAPKAINVMTDAELIQHGKNIRAAIDEVYNRISGLMIVGNLYRSAEIAKHLDTDQVAVQSVMEVMVSRNKLTQPEPDRYMVKA